MTHGSSNSSNGTRMLLSSRLLNSAGYQNSFKGCSATRLLLRPLSGLRLLPRGRRALLPPLLLLLLVLLGAGAVATLLLLLLVLLLLLTVAVAAAAELATALVETSPLLLLLLLLVACADATGPVDRCRRSRAAASALRSATRCRFCSTRAWVADSRCRINKNNNRGKGQATRCQHQSPARPARMCTPHEI